MTQALRTTGLRGLLFFLLIAFSITGCTSSAGTGRPGRPSATSPSPASVTSSSHVTQTRAAQATLSRLVSAVRHDDRTSWDHLIAANDPAFAPRSGMVFANLATLQLPTLTATMTMARGTLDPGRRDVLGKDAWLGQAAIAWTVDHEARPAVSTLWLTFVPAAGGQLLAGTADVPVGQPAGARPLWLLEPVRLVTDGPVTMIAAQTATSDLRADHWAARAAAAAAAVRRRVGSTTASHWSGGVVVEAPGSDSSFEQLLGVPAGSYDRIAAVAWPEAPDPKDAPVRVVINPAQASRLTDTALDIVLTHEVVHIATDSPSSPAPLWVVEGYADLVAFERRPAAAAVAEKSLLASVRKHGAPSTLPTDADFDPARATTLEDSYTLSWLACRYLVEHWSSQAMDTFYVALDTTDTRDLDAALHGVLETDRATFVRGWRDYLRRAAQRAK